ncbi:NAD(P) transhydrogenase subunit alpha [Rubrivirga marina]|uniref:proton-translocating NAD(P)(+) transhydrogenase n=1 Tax=Rubrivirga marina TaxID=1196024 RepID=A0A271IWP3_9BACT|nr:NAD(P) transhydrogenase subunit alpha [Rubrivirga marina]PAP75527.1 NAD(P) transhydrogenase subunit alpha [Rubrivirga marina]
MPLQIGVPRETAPGEARVALSPDAVRRLKRSDVEVVVERGAGDTAFMGDAAFEAAGARLGSRADALGQPVVATVRGLPEADLSALAEGAVVIGLLRPLDEPEAFDVFAQRGATTIAMELVPRTTRAQKMDALSAMSTVAGYRAVLLAAERLPKFFPLLTTAAGTVRPAKVLILGAGVAGLQALATARRLGAVTSAYDVRTAAREQVESVGARFVELDLEAGDAEDARGYAKALDEDQQARQVAALATHIAEHDVVITTALIPGRPAPSLITTEGVEGMAPGSVIVDLAAPNGGNCAATLPGETAEHAGVSILGPLDLAAEMPLHASEMYARTVAALIQEFATDGVFRVDLDDEIQQSAVVTHGGAIVNVRVRSARGLAEADAPASAPAGE